MRTTAATLLFATVAIVMSAGAAARPSSFVLPPPVEICSTPLEPSIVSTESVDVAPAAGAFAYAGTTSCYDWNVDPPYEGPYFESELDAAAADPAPPLIVATALPTWRNLYDWPNGHGYVGWRSSSNAPPGLYGLAPNLGGNPGLWLWPAGGDYLGAYEAEWTYTAPGTTRIQRLTLDFAYRNKLLAHHCITIGLRTGATVVTQTEWCKPVRPPDSQRDVDVVLADPAPNPTAKTLFFKIRMDCKDALTCSKHIPTLDPLSTGGFARVKLVDMTLVDDDVPNVAASGPFAELDGTYINGRGSYDLTVSADDAGSGITRDWAERIGGATIASGDAPCDPIHNTPALDTRICPPAHEFTSTIGTLQFPEATNRFVAKASDVARNTGATATWRIMIDRTPPTAASGFALANFDPDEGAGEITWQTGTDPALPDGTPGSGVGSHLVRFNQNGVGWSDWVRGASPVLSVEGVTGDTVSVEVREVDAVGNASATASTTITLTPVAGPEVADDTGNDSEEAALMRDFGISATEAEARLAREPAIEALDDHLATSFGDRYGGVWVDHTDGGLVKVATTQRGITDGVAAQFGLPDALVREVAVARTFAQLEATAEDIAGQAEAIADPASRPTAEVDVQANRVRVTVPNPFDPQVDQFLAGVRGVYGVSVGVVFDAAEVQTLACTRFQCPPPIRGGIEIINFKANAICSAGFNVRNTDGTKFVLTAGHCRAGTWRHGRRTVRKIGAVTRRQFAGRLDSELIKIDNPDFWDPGNLIFHTRAQPAFPITSVARRVTVGTYLCRSGRTTGTRCGRVIRTGYNWQNLRGLALVQACSDHGDSGGSVYSARRHRAYGVLSIGTGCTHGRRDFFGFEPIRFTLATFDVSVVTG
jgi:streptogrisin C